MAQTVKNQPAVRETWLQSLDWEDPLEEGTATPVFFGASLVAQSGLPWWLRL